MKTNAFAALVAAVLLTPAAHAGFVNGNFETGDASGWTTGGGFRGNELNSTLDPVNYLPGGANYSSSINHSAIVTAGFDANTGNNLNRVYSGNYSYRVEDTAIGGYGSAITQTVSNYQDSSIFFAWAAVLQGAHGVNDAATFKLTLTDLTSMTVLVNREYNAATTGSGVDSRFTLSSTGYYYTSWQVEQLTNLTLGHTYQLSLLAADCEPTGHRGYVYLDGFGAVTPPVVDNGTVPEPGTLALLGGGLLGMTRLARRNGKVNVIAA
ncbi:PEP-CTERM sorting domain-containing protein [Methylomonas methanica]|uniref:Ice-binding protein C-terminal domain-containing protein n=1 Tax=Methylomonas methanica TaxID=421 RepID=A0A177MKA3_METMH|nr:PEP-CTERM sorting domain-containing protein [Methylomonas methanica]OAI05360.1 hypothetical protein A1332_13500 [Methylomonas methanica]